MADLRVAVIGCGSHAQEHFGQIAADSRLHLAAIAEIDALRLEKNRVQWRPDQAFAEWRRMLDVCELDLVFNFHKVYQILDEMVVGGEIMETSKTYVNRALRITDYYA